MLCGGGTWNGSVWDNSVEYNKWLMSLVVNYL